MGLEKDEMGVIHFAEGATDGDEVREDVVGLMEVVAEDVSMDLGKMYPATAAVEMAEDFPFNLPDRAASTHFMTVQLPLLFYYSY